MQSVVPDHRPESGKAIEVPSRHKGWDSQFCLECLALHVLLRRVCDVFYLFFQKQKWAMLADACAPAVLADAPAEVMLADTGDPAVFAGAPPRCAHSATASPFPPSLPPLPATPYS